MIAPTISLITRYHFLLQITETPDYRVKKIVQMGTGILDMFTSTDIVKCTVKTLNESENDAVTSGKQA